MKSIGWLILALLSCRAVPLLAQSELLISVSDRLVTTEQLQRTFKQEKSLPFLSRPLLSSGEFFISRDKGLLWRVTEPVVSEMTVNAYGVQLDGRNIEDAGAGELIESLMQAFMTGNLSGVESTFIVTGELRGNSWHLNLRPRSLVLKSALERIEVDGASFLQQLVILEKNGTVSKIRLFELGETDHAKPN